MCKSNLASLCVHIYIKYMYNACVYTVRKAFNYTPTFFVHRVFALLNEQDRPALHVGHLTGKAAAPCTALPR